MIGALGIDYGTKRIGIAGCDALGISVRGIEVVEERTPEKAADRIAEIAREREATVLVFGMPYNMDGSEHKSKAKIEKFADLCAARSGLTIEYIDERLTSMQAERQLREAGFTRKGRKQRVDKVAAALLLQAWIQSRGGFAT
jgi:putative pre-16S rRNA nuclease